MHLCATLCVILLSASIAAGYQKTKTKTVSLYPTVSGAHLNPGQAHLNTHIHKTAKAAKYGAHILSPFPGVGVGAAGLAGYNGYGAAGGFLTGDPYSQGLALQGGLPVGGYGAGALYGGYGAQVNGYGPGLFGQGAHLGGYVPSIPGSYTVRTKSYTKTTNVGHYPRNLAGYGSHASVYHGGYAGVGGYGAAGVGYHQPIQQISYNHGYQHGLSTGINSRLRGYGK